MQLAEVSTRVANVPHMTRKQGRTIYEFVLRNKPSRILELGFAHGVSACYMAAALQELGGDRRILTIDTHHALEREPSIKELLDRCELGHLVTPIFADTSYTWELMRMLGEQPQPRFDFVYVDGAHRWDPDGFAFLLADRLLAPGSWVVFDDLDWTLASSPTLRDTDWVRELPEDQRNTAQVRKVFELLVRTHPDYGDFREQDGWAWARKRPAGPWSRLTRR
jgi:predicted O-methyltransferase YrrM